MKHDWEVINESLRARVQNQTLGQVGYQLRYPLMDQVQYRVRYQVWNQVQYQVWNQIGYQIWDQVRDEP